jgi:Ca2+-binding RTX toxin-like protein
LYRTLCAALAGTMAVTAATLVPTSAAAAAVLCYDHLSNVQRTATQVGTEQGEVINAQPNAVVAALGGFDTVFTNAAAPKAVACLGTGNDVFSHTGTVVPVAGFSVRGGDGFDTIFGGTLTDVLVGESGNDGLHGLGGNDILQGSEGDDALQGGDGNDNLNGGAGNDNLFGENGDDVLLGGDGTNVLDGGPGIDTCNAPVGSHTTYKNCEVF